MRGPGQDPFPQISAFPTVKWDGPIGFIQQTLSNHLSSTNSVQGAVLGTGVAKEHQRDKIPAQVSVVETKQTHKQKTR